MVTTERTPTPIRAPEGRFRRDPEPPFGMSGGRWARPRPVPPGNGPPQGPARTGGPRRRPAGGLPAARDNGRGGRLSPVAGDRDRPGARLSPGDAGHRGPRAARGYAVARTDYRVPGAEGTHSYLVG